MMSALQSGTIVNLPPTAILQHDLQHIDQVIGMFRVAALSDSAELDDMQWLQHRRRFLLTAIASRRMQRQQKIVDLSLWRSGGFRTAEVESKVA